ncbi:hypothetical protein BDW22DRAFT_226324 [Trametopsis cervina]|nr:hypothetical protein BDW22DRAFT_226324 [Trametopsis cervina]
MPISFIPDKVQEAVKHQHLVEVKAEKIKHNRESQIVLTGLQIITNVFILVESLHQGILKGTAGPTTSTPSVHVNFMNAELQQAYATGNYNVINAYNQKQAADLQPNMTSIQNSAEKAFIQATNESDGNTYYILPSEYGWIWTYSYQDTTAPTQDCYVQIGTYSANSNYLGISTFVWDNKWAKWTPGVASFAFSFLVGRFVQQRIGGALFDAAVENAMAAAAADTDEAFTGMSAVFWANAGGALAGLVAGAAAYVLLMFLINFVYKQYFLVANVWNWTNTQWTVANWYSDNADISQPGTWSVKTLPGSGSYKEPDGTVVPAKQVYYGTYAFVNHSKVLQGLGIALQIYSADDPTQGFEAKYCVHRLEDNTIGLQAGLGDLGSFYNASGSWAPSDTTKVHTSVAGVPILATTPSVGGASSQLYSIDIHIGNIIE